MKRRTRKPNPSSATKAVENRAQLVEVVAEPQDTVHRETETPVDPANSVATHSEWERSEIPIELEREIENFTNSFHVQRASGTPPAPREFSAAVEAPAQQGAPVSRPTTETAADRRANPRYAFHATAEVASIDTGATSKARVRDLSQQGCYLDTDNPLALGTTARVRMTKDTKSLEVQGRVVYNQPGRGMGLMFTAVKPEHGGTLDAWINESRETSWLANNRRRSQRVLVKVPVRVSVQAGATPLTEEETHTLAVSAHGALVAVSAPLYRGQRLTLSNPQTKDSLECVVAHIDRFPNEPLKIGVEFLLPNPTFWHVAFPPKDWSPRHPDAKQGPQQGSSS